MRRNYRKDGRLKNLIIFAKVPVAGAVKTRLIGGALDAEKVCTLYTAFLKDTIVAGAMTCADTISIFFTPADKEREIKKIVKSLKLGARNERRIKFVPKIGDSFSNRVAHAFDPSDQDPSQVMIGADSPTQKPESIDMAFEQIETRGSMVLGPTGGGGLYLIGFPAGTQIDYDSAFGSSSELLNFATVAKNTEMPLKILPELLDVDTQADLVSLVALLKSMEYERAFVTSVFPLHTHKAIEEMRLAIARQSGDTRDKYILIENDGQ